MLSNLEWICLCFSIKINTSESTYSKYNESLHVRADYSSLNETSTSAMSYFYNNVSFSHQGKCLNCLDLVIGKQAYILKIHTFG